MTVARILGDLDAHLFAEGTHREAYRKLGAHRMQRNGVDGIGFAVWAPNAGRVSVVGDFNGWDAHADPMDKRWDCGVWERFIPQAREGDRYKYALWNAGGNALPLKADPYAFRSELRPATASIVSPLPPPPDALERENEERIVQHREAPIAIYEVHLGSWKRRPEEANRFLTYRELADDLLPYAKWMGFTHVELLPVSEYPFDGSWGYQPTGLFAPTSRYGTPEDFRYFVERAHGHGLGVLIDWVPGHFPADEHGLANFDGTHLYEHADPRQGWHPDWDTYVYNYGRREVKNFLISNALFWLDEYGVDGLRVDAVASMLYLDYSRPSGEWVPNRFGGNENIEAIQFLRELNEAAYGEYPHAITVAEESTAWPMVSTPTYLGGLGFGYKWNMGWMHDTLAYMSRNPVHRKFHHDQLTFSMVYAFSENYVLPLSHDEVVHGKGSILARMPGDAWQRFANVRLLYTFMYAHPGKKLLFMGNEFAQEREWNHDASLDWHLTNDANHAGIQRLVRDLNRLYTATPALFQRDATADGFRWLAQDWETSVISFLRSGHDAREFAIAVCNFTPVVREGFRIGVPFAARYTEVLNSDAKIYGGSDAGNGGSVAVETIPSHGFAHSISLTLPPLGAIVLLPSFETAA
jgi:1,4-alpha-glucan branching enzyme